MIEKSPPRFFCVEAVFGENVRAGGSRCPGIDQRGLNDPVPLRRSCDVAPCLVVHERHGGIPFQAAGIITEAASQDTQYVRIDFNTCNMPLSKYQRRQDV